MIGQRNIQTTGQSTTYDNNYSTIMQCSKITSKSFTDGVATFSDGTVTNLMPPVELSDAVTKGLVDGFASVGAPDKSVQLNNISFGGSPNLTYDNITQTLALNGVINISPSTSIIAGKISGLTAPTTGNSAVNKQYVDMFTSALNTSTISSDVGVTYTANAMLGGIITRDTATQVYGVSVTDTTATAASLVAGIPAASVGYSTSFRIISSNVKSDNAEGRDSFIVTLQPGAGVTILPNNIQIRRTYILDATLIVTSLQPPGVTISVIKCGYDDIIPTFISGDSIYQVEILFAYSMYGSIRFTNFLLWGIDSSDRVNNNYSYTTEDVRKQMIIRSPSADATDTFGYLMTSRCYNQMFVIKNTSGHIIDLVGGSNLWIVPLMTIPGLHQKYLCFTSEDVPPLTTKGNNYTMDIYNTTGGSGSGLVIKVMNIRSYNFIDTGGLGYEQGGTYTTTNLTNPSATGLIVVVVIFFGNNDGIVSDTLPILNFLFGGYSVGDVIRINGGNNGATFTLTSVNSIEDYSIETLGSDGYVSGDIVTVSGPGPGTGATIELIPFLTITPISTYQL